MDREENEELQSLSIWSFPPRHLVNELTRVPEMSFFPAPGRVSNATGLKSKHLRQCSGFFRVSADNILRHDRRLDNTTRPQTGTCPSL